jgi:hypothetical protein
MSYRATLATAAALLLALGAGGRAQTAEPTQQPPDEPPPAPLFCTVTTAHLCSADSCAKTDKFGDIALPAKMLVHFDSRVIATTSDQGFPHLSPIATYARTGDGTVLGGIDGGLGWTIHLSATDPRMTFAVATNTAVLTGIGSCEASK